MEKGQLFGPKSGRIPFESYAKTWVETRRAKGAPLAPRTRELYLWQLDKYILHTFGRTDLGKITLAAVRTWFGEMQSVGAPTAAKCYRLLRAILNTAVDDELSVKNPCSIKGAGAEAASECPMLTVDQVTAIAEAADDRWRALILVAAWCGLRFGELAALRTRSVDLEAGTIEVTEAMSLLHGGVRYVGKPKSEAGRRVVFIPPHLLEGLRYHRNIIADPDGYFFVGPLEAPLTATNFGTKVWRPALSHLESLAFTCTICAE